MILIVRFIHFVNRINELIGKVLSFGIVFLFVVVLKEVVGRYFFNNPTSWGNELTQLTFAIYVILSGGFVLQRGGHVNVDIIYSRFSVRARAAVDIFTFFLFFLFVGSMLWYGTFMAWESVSVLEHSHSAWNPPLYPIKLMVPLGVGLVLLQGIAKLLGDILVLITGEEQFLSETKKGGAS
jgi:TRAP-type mannitol/chloroaromatic compound transport system permease small subunit